MQARWIAVWAGIAVLATIDVVWCNAVGLSFRNWPPFLAATGLIAAIALIYGLSGRSARIAGMARGVVLWMWASLLGAILTYAAAAQDRPLWDRQLAAADAALGFDWGWWLQFFADHPLLKLPVSLAYNSLLVQILLSIMFLAFTGQEDRTAELLLNFTITILLTVVVFYFYPALGPGVEVPNFWRVYGSTLVGLRTGNRGPIDIMHLSGIVAFPSFHTILALLFTYAVRRTLLFVPFVVLNTLMVISIPTEGGHYLIDLLPGFVLAGLSILATNALLARLPPASRAEVVSRGGPAADEPT